MKIREVIGSVARFARSLIGEEKKSLSISHLSAIGVEAQTYRIEPVDEDDLVTSHQPIMLQQSVLSNLPKGISAVANNYASTWQLPPIPIQPPRQFAIGFPGDEAASIVSFMSVGIFYRLQDHLNLTNKNGERLCLGGLWEGDSHCYAFLEINRDKPGPGRHNIKFLCHDPMHNISTAMPPIDQIIDSLDYYLPPEEPVSNV